MAYEVTKLVNGRPYRYRVHSERDPATGRFRNRWTYLGRADAGALPAPRRPRGSSAREALLDALERLLDKEDIERVSAGAVSRAAGLAHGTFYRYFPNKYDAFRALSERWRSARAVELSTFAVAPSTREEARRTLRRWVELLLRTPLQSRGILRTWYDLSARDPQFAAERRDRRGAQVELLAGYLRVLVERGFADVEPLRTARLLAAMLDGFYREALGEAEHDEARVAAALDFVERGVFGTLDDESRPSRASLLG
jgi:AcrR family transcriptional regulator